MYQVSSEKGLHVNTVLTGMASYVRLTGDQPTHEMESAEPGEGRADIEIHGNGIE